MYDRQLKRWLEYAAFVPDPLPPTLQLGADLWGSLSEADRALGRLSGLARTMPNPHLLIRPFVRREAWLSSRIEGTQADIRDLYVYEAGQLELPETDRRGVPTDVREIANYVRALEYGLEQVRHRPISLSLLREMHGILLSGVRGQAKNPGAFREEQNWIGPEGCRITEARFVPPPPIELGEVLSRLERYIREDQSYPPLVRIALVHYQFEAIHPFHDGNGRLGRLLISLLLASWGLLELPLLYLSAYFDAHRSSYYDLLRDVSVRGAWNEWLTYFLRGVADQAQDAILKAERLRELQTTWRALLTQRRASSLALQLVDHLFEGPVLTIPQAQRALGVTYKSARLNVEKLIAEGILRQLGDDRYGKAYLADAVLDIVWRSEGNDT
jgi:Fic family protein